MIETKELRAQLEVKKQELKTTKREMESLMKYVIINSTLFLFFSITG